MNPRVEFLTSKLIEYLDRRTMPRGLVDKPKAQDAETQALVHCLVRFSPKQEYGDWWARMETQIDENADTRAWPTAAEIKKAAISLRGTTTKHVAEADDIDPLEIIAERMQRNEPVGDGYAYGRLAVDMQTRGLVTSDILRKYRSDLYFKLKRVYGEEKAREMEAQFIKRHAQAEATPNSDLRRGAPSVNPNRIPAREYD